jgi:hypothetical protein
MVKFVGTFMVAFGLSLLIIPGLGILYGLSKKHVILPIYEHITDPGPLYVDDKRCCR